jgi:hypothetical protein
MMMGLGGLRDAPEAHGRAAEGLTAGGALLGLRLKN